MNASLFQPRYMFYFETVRKDTKAALEATSEGKVSVASVAKAVGEKWRAMSEADKAPYQRMHEEAKARNENAEAGTADASGASKKRKRGEPGKRKRTKNAYAK